MKYKFLIVLWSMFSFHLGFTQRNSHASTISASGGYVEDGYGMMATYGHYITMEDFIGISVFFSVCNDRFQDGLYTLPYYIFTVQPGYYNELLVLGHPRSPLIVRGGVGGIFGYEEINKGNVVLHNGAILNANSAFIYGAFISGELEYNLTGNDLSVLLTANEHYHINSELGHFSLYVGLGMKYYIF